MTKIALALGGNLGKVEETFSSAIRLLEQAGLSDVVVSSFYSNPAINCIPGTPDFINGALTGSWNKSPEALLALTQKIEIVLGRPEIHRSDVSRILDIDIVLFGDKIVSTEKLIIPHPRASLRDFVLVPLNEIAPDLLFPDTGKSVNSLLLEFWKRKYSPKDNELDS